MPSIRKSNILFLVKQSRYDMVQKNTVNIYVEIVLLDFWLISMTLVPSADGVEQDQTAQNVQSDQSDLGSTLSDKGISVPQKIEMKEAWCLPSA